MNKKFFVIFAAILPLFLSVAIAVLLYYSTDDLSLTGIARSEFLLLTNPSPTPPASEVFSEQKDEMPNTSDHLERKLYVYEKDLSMENTKLVNLSAVNLEPAVLENRIKPNKKDDLPVVLIIHTHPAEGYANRISLPTLPEGAVSGIEDDIPPCLTVVDVGEIFAKTLEEKGIKVIHVKKNEAEPNNAWEESHKTVAAYLTAYPSIRYILDIHREEHRDAYGNVICPVTSDRKSAQIEILVGTNVENEHHVHYEKNLALAMTFKENMDAEEKDLSLPVKLVNQTLNHELSEGYLTLSIGSVGSLPEQIKSGAQRAADIFAKTVLVQ